MTGLKRVNLNILLGATGLPAETALEDLLLAQLGPPVAARYDTSL